MEIKEGDMVEILELNDSILESHFKIGDICEVREVLGERYTLDLSVFTCDKLDFWFFNYNQVKLVENKEEPTIESQRKQVLKHLLEAPITSWEAISKYRITRLSAIIYRLRKDNNISREMIREGKKNWAKYTLIK